MSSGLARARELKHVQVGICGARVGTGISAHVKIEGEMAYDFNRAISQSINERVGRDLARRIELAA